MNLYVRYFDHETLATSVDEAMAFLQTIEEIKIESNAANRIAAFLHSSNLFPFRLKVSYSNYVLFLKTDAETLEQFKKDEIRRKEQKAERVSPISERKKNLLDTLNEEKAGWWDTVLTFKRVITTPETGKCRYIDTRFHVRQHALSAMDAYNRLIKHLQDRADVDPRSQLPSAKSDKFEYTYLGNESMSEKTSDTEENIND
ncbi:MAG: hypothetical protein K2I99_00905 [Bacteroidaceae bacterium]|nr:hypothetical protein [Bacteroidaceae bacterium]